MLVIPCPYCGERDEIEFAYAGEAHIVRPVNGTDMSDAEWADYLFYRKNTHGVFLEQWSHAAGCRQFFNVARNTVTNEIVQSYKIGERFSGEPFSDGQSRQADAAEKSTQQDSEQSSDSQEVQS